LLYFHKFRVLELLQSKLKQSLMHYPPTTSYQALIRQVETLNQSKGGDDGIVLKGVNEYGNQFIPMQIPETGPGVVWLNEIEPVMEGSSESPDMLLTLEMLGFNIGEGEEIKRANRAIMQLTIGQENAMAGRLEPLYWVLSAGLELYSATKNKKAGFKDLAVEVDKAFNKEYIEIPGGAANLKFTVLKEQEPKWWEEVFRFIKSDVGTAMTAAFGLPGIPQIAVQTVETLLNKFKNRREDILFSSKENLQLAVSAHGKQELSKGHARIEVGCLNPGLFALIRGRDYLLFRDTPGKFDLTNGEYIPEDYTLEDRVTGKKNPFANCTYAIFRVGMKETDLKQKFNFSSKGNSTS
jgi:hypothetical protein